MIARRRIAVAEEEANSWWKEKLKAEEDEKKRAIAEAAEAAKEAAAEGGEALTDENSAKSPARKVQIVDVSDDADAAKAKPRVNPRTRFITDLRHRVKEAAAMAAQTEDSDKALEYHSRVYKAKVELISNHALPRRRPSLGVILRPAHVRPLCYALAVTAAAAHGRIVQVQPGTQERYG